MRLYGGKNWLVPLPEGGGEVCFWLRAEKRVCPGEKTIGPPPHVSPDPPLSRISTAL